MLRGHLLCMVALLLFTAAVAAETPNPLEAKIQSLAHPRYAERENAARELLKIGEPALKALKAAAASPDPEIRERAAAIAERIELILRSERLLVAPKLAIKLDKVPLQQALTQVAQKSGLRFQFEPGKDTNVQRSVSLDTGEIPFWEAIHAFYSAAGVVENDMPRHESRGPSTKLSALSLKRLSSPYLINTIRLTDAKSVTATTSSTPVITENAFRIRALPTVYPENKFDAASGEITFHLDVDSAPALTVQEMIGVDIRRALDENGKEIDLAYPAPPYQPSFGRAEQLLIVKQLIMANGEVYLETGLGGHQFYSVTLKTGTNRPERLAELQGVVVARVVGPTEPMIEVPDVFAEVAGRTFSSNGRTIEIKEVQSGDGKGQVALRICLAIAAESVNEILNFPVQVKGRVRPFVRINRRSGRASSTIPNLQFVGEDDKPVATAIQLVQSTFNGETSAIEVILKADRAAVEEKGIKLVVSGRRPVLVEMPFVLKDVQLP